MKNNYKIFILVILGFIFALPALALKDQQGTVEFGDYKIDYDQVDQVEDGFVSYYFEGNIVLSVFDTNNDGKNDLWLRYDSQGFLDLEVIDTDYDQEPDTFTKVDQDEDVVEQITPEFEVPEVVIEDLNNPNKNLENNSNVYVVNPPGPEYLKKGFGDFNKLIFIVILIIFFVVGIKIFKKVKK